ncbi:hypothetical protein AB0870_12055 [Microbacterium proteolyticum]|uniref:hypothetical protein n=1 Tax=Microbacterium proteolyticum TaxID=1572644 RepID=UPI002416D3FA|nr:hypothetical protein [Microbacterium proteolyticum]
MGNPARVAHEILTAWREKATAKPGVNNPALIGVRKQADIVRLATALSEIEALLGQLERDGVRVKAYRNQIPDWWSGLIVPDYSPGQGVPPDGIITAEHLDEIDACASFLDFYVRTLSPEHYDNLRAVVAAARKLLEEDEGLSQQLRMYIHRLLREIEHALDDDAMGETFDFAEAALRLRVAFQAAQQEDTSGRGTWHTLWTAIASGSAANMLTQGVGVVIAAIAAGS